MLISLLLAVLAAGVLLQGFTLWSLAVLNIALALLAVFTLARAYRAGLTYAPPLLHAVLAAFGLWLAVAAALAAAPLLSALAVFQQLVLILAFVAAGGAVAEEARWQRLQTGVAGLAVVLGAGAICAWLGAWSTAVSATFVQRNSLSAWLLLAVFVILPRLARACADAPRVKAATVAWSLAVFIPLLAAFVTTSRGALLALIVAYAGFYLSLSGAAREGIGKTALALALWAFLVANLGLGGAAVDAARSLGAAAPVFTPGASFEELLADVREGERAGPARGGSLSQRLLIWRASATLLQSVPWHGFGPGSFRLVYPPFAYDDDRSDRFYAHNDLLQVGIELGVPGLLLVVALCVALYRLRARARAATRLDAAHRIENEALFWGIVAVAAHSLVSYNFYVPATLILIGYVLARYARATTATDLRFRFRVNERLRPAFFYALPAVLVAAPVTVLLPAQMMANHYARGVAAFAAGRLEPAARAFERAAHWYPDDQTEVARAQVYLAGAEAAVTSARRRELLAAAAAHLQAAARLNRYSAAVAHGDYLLVRRALAAAPDLDTLLERQLRIALARDPRYFPVRMDHARYLRERGQHNAALALMEAGLRQRVRRREQALEYLALLRELRLLLHDEAGVLELDQTIASMRMELKRKP